jgi:hypothetical protein
MNNFYVSISLTSLQETAMVLNYTLNSTHSFFPLTYRRVALNELQLLHPYSRVSGCLMLLVTHENNFDLGSTSRGTYFFFLRLYNFGEVLAFPTNYFHLERFLMQFFQFVIFIFVMSLFTSSSTYF